MAAKQKISVDQGSTERFYVRPKQPNGDTFNFDGYGARMHIRQTFESPEFLLELSTDTGGLEFVSAAHMLEVWGRDEEGWMLVEMTPAQTAAITAGTYVYDLDLYTGDPDAPDFEYRAIEGSIQFRRQVTR